MDATTPCRLCPLRELKGFKPLDATSLAWIQRHKRGEWQRLAGSDIIVEGAPDERLYTLLRGWAFRFKTLTDGRRQILNILLPGDMLGLQAELMAAAPHGVEALTDVTLCAFRRDTVWALFRDHGALALDLTWLSAHGERLADDVLTSVGRRNAMERVAALLVHLHKRAASSGLLEGASVPFPLTQQHIADVLGLSVVHTNRVLQRLRRQELIRLADGRLAVGDMRALRRVAEYWEQPAPLRPLL